MSAPATVPDFLDICRKSGVVDEARLSALERAKAESPMAAAKALIRAGALTKFQASQLLAGKYRGLMFDRLKLLDRIGSGGMGTVFCASTPGFEAGGGQGPPPDQAGDEGPGRLPRPGGGGLDHPNIVVYDATRPAGSTTSDGVRRGRTSRRT